MRGMYNKLPQYVYLKNEKFIINTDYRIFIEFEERMQEEGNKQVILDTLRSFYPAFFKIISKNLLKDAVDKFLWFYRCGKKDEEIPKKTSNKGNLRAFSYNHDDLYIWGEFHRLHGVDLTKDKIHWWKFKAMWLTLPSDCEFNKIKGYRTYKGKDKDILELKDIYKLPLTKAELEDKLRRDKIFDMLKWKRWLNE